MKRLVLCRLLGLIGLLGIALTPLACGSSSSGTSPNQTITSITEQYVEEFYPLWFTFLQSSAGTPNSLVGPEEVTPLYGVVVAINVDTLYASAFVSIATQPVVLTIPSTTVTYSMLTLDPYGNIFQTTITPQAPGVYALTAPGWNGTLPSGVTQVSMPYDFTTLIFRADTHTSTGTDVTTEAETFRASLLLQPLSAYQSNPTGGAAAILPEVPTFAASTKNAADSLIAVSPITFLQLLQAAVGSSNTPPLTTDQQQLVNTFNSLFGTGTGLSTSAQQSFANATQAAHTTILNNYLDNTGTTNWIYFNNIGDWGTNYLDRSSITEFIQYANGPSTAAYFQAFNDSTGTPLYGPNSYVLTFPAGEIPQASRFWSVTAYTPQSVELVANSADVYAVASYTPGLVTNSDGSISIYMAPSQPSGVPAANWLPIPIGPFNVMLRVYGPEGSVANQTYVPPAIVKQ